MGNKTRKDGAFKGERTRLAGRGEERKIGGGKKKKERRIREGVDESHLVVPFVSVLPPRSSTFPRGVMRRVITTTNDAFTSI